MNKLNWIAAFILVFSLTACSSDDNGGGGNVVIVEDEADNVNDFVWKGLNAWYFWQSEVPNLADNRFQNNEDYVNFLNNKQPEDLFYSLLYQYGDVDKFSWIVDDVNELLQNFSGISKSSGMDLDLAYLDQNAGTVLGMVNYVVPNSPAANKGVERGDLIIGVNGEQLTDQNYTSLFDESFNVTIGKNPTISNGQISITEDVNVSIQAIEINENPVHYHDVITSGNHKVAYLVLNSYKSVYNDELNEAFASFKAEGATDLILDLRYNGGGSLGTAVGLAQMITGQFTNETFATLEFNDNFSNYNESYKFENSLPIYEFVNGQTEEVGEEVINSLNLSRVYVLTSRGTASASELTMVGLSPYIDVTQIGSTTYGKFVGSTTLYDSPDNAFLSYDNRDQSHDYAMQPIIFAYYNANHQTFTSGLEPQQDLVYTIGDYIGMRGFGEFSDPALAKAMNLITGNALKLQPREHLKTSTSFLGTSKTLQKFGTELYIEPNQLILNKN